MVARLIFCFAFITFAFVFAVIVVSGGFPAESGRHVVFKGGATYPVLEKDAYEEILERVKEKDLAGKFLELRKTLPQKLKVNVKGLKKATETTVRTVTLTYRLPFSITDAHGNIIYPEGYTFNPLDYVRFPYILVFFDPTSPVELRWLRESGYLSRWDTILVITRGNIRDTETLTGRTVYAGDEKLLSYFSVKKVPSVVYQNGDKLVVMEVGVYGKNSK